MSAEILTAAVNGFEMEYVRFGHGSRHLVILPGLSIKSVTASAKGIANAYSLFAEEYTVFLFDRRSGKLPVPYTVHDMAQDTAAAIAAARIKNAAFMGVSQGGMIAQLIAIEHPELVDKLVLGSTASRVDNANGTVLDEWVRLSKEKNRDALSGNFAEMIYSDEFLRRFGAMLAEFDKTVTDEELERFCILAEGTSGFDIYNELDRIKCPVLVLGAWHDKVLGGRASTELAEKLGCDLYMYGDYGHAVYDEAPDYKQRILDFLRR